MKVYMKRHFKYCILSQIYSSKLNLYLPQSRTAYELIRKNFKKYIYNFFCSLHRSNLVAQCTALFLGTRVAAKKEEQHNMKNILNIPYI